MYGILLVVRFILCAICTYYGISFILSKDPINMNGWVIDSNSFIGWLLIGAAVVLLISIITSILNHKKTISHLGGKW